MIFFAPFWIPLCLVWGAISQTPMAKSTRTPEEQDYDKHNYDKARDFVESLREPFK